MEIAIGGESTAESDKRAIATMRLTDDIADKWDDDWTDGEGHDMSDYKGAYTVVDSDYDSQTVVGTPMTVNTKTYAPIILGITKGLYDHICELYSLTVATYIEDAVFTISNAEEDLALEFISLYKDANNNCIIIGLAQVDDTNSTVLQNDTWVKLDIPIPDSDEVEEYSMATEDVENGYVPIELTFTPAEQSEGD